MVGDCKLRDQWFGRVAVDWVSSMEDMSTRPFTEHPAVAAPRAGETIPIGPGGEMSSRMVAEARYGPLTPGGYLWSAGATREPIPSYVGVKFYLHDPAAVDPEQWREDVGEALRRANIPTSTLSIKPPTRQSTMEAYPELQGEELEQQPDLGSSKDGITG